MKKTLTIVLIFAAVLAALLAVAVLAERLRPAEEPEQAQEPAPAAEETTAVAVMNEMDEAGATVIRLSDGAVSVAGLGASASGGVVTIGYPGTYRIGGTLEDGQLVVDLGDFHGAVYLLMEGASVSSGSGPALHIKQSDKTVLYLTEGTENTLSDGADYLVTEGQEERSGAGIYSADDLVIEGEGALTVRGNSADGIRSKDSLTITGGTLRVYSADDGLQASDYIDVQGGDITIGAYGDGLATTEGYVAITGGTLDVACAGDGVAAVTELSVTGGAVSVTAYGGADNYGTIALADLSAKGMKADTVSVAGGVIALDTADDAIHAETALSVTGGDITIASGDDALNAGAVLDISGGTVVVSSCYEAMEAPLVRVRDGVVYAAAENNGVDAGEDGFVMTGGLVTLSAPCCIGSDGVFSVESGSLYLTADGSESPLSFLNGSVTGGTVVLSCAAANTAVLLEGGALSGSLLFVLPAAVPEGTEITLSDDAGTAVLSFAAAQDSAAVLLASGALGTAQTYTLTAGEYTMQGSLSDGVTVIAPEAQASAAAAMGGASGGMMPMGGGPRP